MLIGLYRHIDPLKSIRKERIEALAQEALRQNIKLLCFTMSDVDFEKEKITGKIFDGYCWRQQTMPFPTVMINEVPMLASKRTVEEKKLREKIHCTTYLIGTKENIYAKLNKSVDYCSLVIPTIETNGVESIITLLKEQQSIVIKPINGRQGKGIYFITKKGRYYVVKDHNAEERYTPSSFIEFLQSVLSERRYIGQPYIQCMTKNGEPYDFRIHVQRRGDGQWAVTKTYPRIGAKESILSNISRGGRTQEINSFLKEQFTIGAQEKLALLESTALQVADYINSFYQFDIDELGIDLAIDTQGHLWLYEVNTGPQTRYHEEERAVHTLAYAKYLTEKHRITSPTLRESNDQAQVRKITIGMLTSRKNVTYFTTAAVAAAKLFDAELFYFNPTSLNIEEKSIVGKYFDGEIWIEKKYSYQHEVDVIFDRLRLIGSAKYKWLYQELTHLPITHQSFNGPLNKLILYEKLSTHYPNASYLIPFIAINNSCDVFDFLTVHKEVILKPIAASQGIGVTYMTVENNRYVVKDKKDIKLDLTFTEFEQFLNNYLQKNKVVAQKFIQCRTLENQPFDIRVHLVRGDKGKWNFSIIYPRIGVHYEKISGTGEGGYIGSVEPFLKRHYSEQYKAIMKNIKSLSLELVEDIAKMYNAFLSEVGIDLILDKEGNIYLLEFNVHQPGVIYYEFHLTKHIVAYAVFLAKQYRSQMIR